MEVKVELRDVIFNDPEDGFVLEWTFGTLAISSVAKELYEAVLGKTMLYKLLTVATDQQFFIYVGEEGNLSGFDVESREHLFYIKAPLAMKWLTAIRERFLRGKMMFKTSERNTLCLCHNDDITWKDFEPYRKRGLHLKPGQVITKLMVLKAYQIIQESFAQATNLEPSSLQELCLKQVHLPSSQPYLDEKAFWTIPYLLMKHEGLIALSIAEETQNNERIFISLYP